MKNNQNLHRASYQEISSGGVDDNSVRCRLCPHNCKLRNGKYGICQTRVNHEGELYTLAYGNPCSVSVDPIEKKPLFHFYPGSEIFSLSTAGCNFHCLNCQNWSISQSSPREYGHYDLSPKDIVDHAQLHNSKSIAFTYTEPTVFYEFMSDIAMIAKERGIKTVLISNGYINRQPLHTLSKYIDAANIDLKCFDDKLYYKLTGGKLLPVSDTLKTLKDNGVWLEITNLVIPSWTDDFIMIDKMCKWLVKNGFAETPLHLSRFFPTYKLSHLQPTPPSVLIRAKEVAENAGLKYVYIGNIPLLNSENTYCPNCGKLLIERNGYVVKSNNIIESRRYDWKGICCFCGEFIPGVFQFNSK